MIITLITLKNTPLTPYTKTRNQSQVFIVKFSLYDLKRLIRKVAVITKIYYKLSHAGKSIVFYYSELK